MTFHDSLLVSNETANLACITVNTISVCLFILFFFFLVIFSVNVMEERKPFLRLYLGIVSLFLSHSFSLM